MKFQYIITIFLTGLILFSRQSFGQGKQHDSTLVKKICGDLNISANLGAEVINAMQTNHYQIDTLIKSKSVSPVEKQKLFILLMNERETKVKSLLDAEQFEKLTQLMQGYLSSKRQKHQAKLNIIIEAERKANN